MYLTCMSEYLLTNHKGLWSDQSEELSDAKDSAEFRTSKSPIPPPPLVITSRFYFFPKIPDKEQLDKNAWQLKQLRFSNIRHAGDREVR